MLANATPPSAVSTACRRAAPIARMVACGGLMMAANSRTPYMPRFEIADEPARARALGKLAHLGGDRRERLGFGLPDDRRDQPAIDRYRDANVGMLKAQDAVVCPGRIRLRHPLERDAPRLDDEIVDRKPKLRLPVGVFGRGR